MGAEWWVFSLAGLGVGFVVGLTGVGGGALMTPLLVLFFGVSPATAVGTDLLFASFTKIVGVGVHGRHGTVDWVVVRRLAAGSLPAAVLTLLALRWLEPQHSNQQQAIITAVGVALVITALGMLLKRWLHAIGQKRRTAMPASFKAAQPAFTVLAGAILGVLVTMTSIGAGALGAVMLVYLYPYRLTPVRLVGTDLAHAIPLALVAGFGHLLIGHVEFDLLGKLLLGSVPGVLVGSLLSTRAPDGVVRNAIALVLLFVAVRLLGAG